MSLESIVNIMSRALEGLGSLPWGVHAVVALAMAAGLVVWLTGQRWVRPVVVVLGAGVGGMLGYFAAPIVGEIARSGVNHATLPDPAALTAAAAGTTDIYRGLLIGLFAGAVAGLLMYRSAMALALGVVMGALLPLTAATILHFWPLSAGASSHVEDQAASWRTDAAGLAHRVQEGWTDTERSSPGLGAARIVLASRLSATSEDPSTTEEDSTAPALARPAERVRAFVQQVASRLSSEWEATPGSHQVILLLCTVIGLASGVITGLTMPAWGAGACTAMFGSAVWLSSFVWLSNAMGAPWKAGLDQGPFTWLCVWGVAALVGMVAQWIGVFAPRKKPAPKPAPAPAK